MSAVLYVSIGNSDDKLPQAEWSEYVTEFCRTVRNYADEIHGEWYSAADSAYQNACMAIVVIPDDVNELRDKLYMLREEFEQNSIAWAVAPETEFI